MGCVIGLKTKRKRSENQKEFIGAISGLFSHETVLILDDGKATTRHIDYCVAYYASLALALREEQERARYGEGQL
jgi:S-adenosylhomocysteine hydrolase